MSSFSLLRCGCPQNAMAESPTRMKKYLPPSEQLGNKFSNSYEMGAVLSWADEIRLASGTRFGARLARRTLLATHASSIAAPVSSGEGEIQRVLGASWLREEC